MRDIAKLYHELIFSVSITAVIGNNNEIKNYIVTMPTKEAVKMWSFNECRNIFPLSKGYSNHNVNIVCVTFGDIFVKLQQKYPDITLNTLLN